MGRQFEYFSEHKYLDMLEVEDLGNVAITAFNDIGQEYILIIRTMYGLTKMLSLGPIVPDLDVLPSEVECKITQMEFSENKLAKAIKQFLNNYKANITQAIIVDREKAISDCRDLIEYIDNDIF